MATITRRPGKTGVRWRAEIRIKRKGKIIHREAETFSTKRAAQQWAVTREVELGQRTDFSEFSVADAIKEYVRLYAPLGNWQRTKRTTLDQISRGPLASEEAADLTSARLVRHITERRRTVSASTAQNDLTWLRVAFKGLRAQGRQVALEAVDDAILICREQGLQVVETDISAEEFLEADEVFTSTTGGGPVAVTRVNNRILGNDSVGEITQRVIDAYWQWHERPELISEISYDVT